MYAVTGHDHPKVWTGADGRVYAAWEITETDVPPGVPAAGAPGEAIVAFTDAFRRAAGGVNAFAMEICYFHADLQIPGAAVTIQPAYGRTAGWTASTANEIMVAAAADTHHHDTADHRFYLDPAQGRIYMQSRPAGGNAGQIYTEIVIRTSFAG